MKKNYLLMAAFATLAFTACTNDDDLGINPNPVVSEVVEGATFEIAVAGDANGNTKTVRPMGSSAASNNVNKILLKAYKWDKDENKWTELTPPTSTTITDGAVTSGTNIAFKLISGDATNDKTTFIESNILTYTAESPEHAPGNEQHIVKRAKVEVVGLEAGTKYQFVAIGYNNESNLNYPYNSGTLEMVSTFENNGVFQANVDAATPDYALQEIFAANSTADTYSVTNGSETTIEFTVTPSLTLKRQVAGILAYFEDVPMFLPKENETSDGKLYRVDKLQVVASHTASDFYFPASLLDDPDFNGIMATDDTEDVLMEFNFGTTDVTTNYPSQTATITADQVNPNYQFYTAGSKPYATSYPAPTGLQLKTNTFFGARYILPYDQHYGETTTLKLRFLTTNDVVLQERDVTTDQTGFDSNTYDIRCNNFYSIGQKLKTDSTEGPDDEDDDDDDNPISLKGKTVSLRINDAWAVLHNMGVE